MEALNNFGIINSQRLLEKFDWNKKTFYSYLISFNEFEGYYRIVREQRHEQALIGAQMIFNYSELEERITKYRVVGYIGLDKTKQKVTELMNKRKIKEQKRYGN